MIQICKYGNPVLRAMASHVPGVDANLRKLADDMLALMMKHKGVGLAAQQVGETVRIFVMYVPPQYDLDAPNGKRLNPGIDEPVIMINPVILGKKGKQTDNEGCLSIPEIFAPVYRAYEVAVSYLDIHGKQQRLDLRGLMARTIQHENDHLDGILFVDRLSALKKISVSLKLKQLKRSSAE